MLLIASCDDILKSTSSSSFRMRRVALRDIRRLQRVSPEHPQEHPHGDTVLQHHVRIPWKRQPQLHSPHQPLSAFVALHRYPHQKMLVSPVEAADSEAPRVMERWTHKAAADRCSVSRITRRGCTHLRHAAKHVEVRISFASNTSLAVHVCIPAAHRRRRRLERRSRCGSALQAGNSGYWMEEDSNKTGCHSEMRRAAAAMERIRNCRDTTVLQLLCGEGQTFKFASWGGRDGPCLETNQTWGS